MPLWTFLIEVYYPPMVMRIKLTNRGRRAIRAAIGTLFVLHVALAQAGPVMIGHSTSEIAAATLGRTLPCHGVAVAPDFAHVVADQGSAALQGSGAGHALPHSSCCLTGGCQCAAGSGACLGVIYAQMTREQTPAAIIRTSIGRGSPSPDLGRELRPPIAP